MGNQLWDQSIGSLPARRVRRSGKLKGKWAAGISPRYFAWVIKDKLAVSERPGGYARNHRPVRRQEEILWLREQGFSRVVSLLLSPHNLHAYEDYGLTWAHFPIIGPVEATHSFNDLYRNLRIWMIRGERLLIHEEELSDKVMGIVGGFLLWAEMVPSAPVAVTVIEKICQKQLGSVGRQYVAIVDGLPRFDPIAEAEREAEQARKAAEEAAEAAILQAKIEAENEARLAAELQLLEAQRIAEFELFEAQRIAELAEMQRAQAETGEHEGTIQSQVGVSAVVQDYAPSYEIRPPEVVQVQAEEVPAVIYQWQPNQIEPEPLVEPESLVEPEPDLPIWSKD